MHPDIARILRLEVAPFLTYQEVMDPGSGLLLIHSTLLAAWTRLRAFIAAPIAINSGFRTVATNARVGGSPGSQHLLGRALDLHCPSRDLSALDLWPRYVDFGFRGIGRGAGWVHLDTRDAPLALWRYAGSRQLPDTAARAYLNASTQSV